MKTFLSSVKRHFFTMAVGDEGGRLGAVEITAESWLEFHVLAFSSLKNKNKTPFYVCARYCAEQCNVEYAI